MMKMVTHDRVSEELWRGFIKIVGVFFSFSTCTNDFFFFFKKTRYIRRLPQPHCVVALAHDLFASPVQKLSQPPDTAHKEAGVDVEEDDGRVAVGILPVGEKRHLRAHRQRVKRLIGV